MARMCALCHVLGCKEASECVLLAVHLYAKSVTQKSPTSPPECDPKHLNNFYQAPHFLLGLPNPPPTLDT